MKKLIPILLLVAAAGAGYWYWSTGQFGNKANRILISGNLELTRVDLAFKIAGRLTELNVREGDWVKKGDVIARLDAATLNQTLARDEASVTGVQSNYQQLETSIAYQKATIESDVAARVADLQTAQAHLDELLAGSRQQEVLQAQAFLRVANETIKARQTVTDQVSALAKAQLKSQLDVSFAQVNLSEARLMLIRGQDALKRAWADLSRSLGEDQQTEYQLVDDVTTPGAPASPDALIDEAIRSRPELAQYRLQLEAARRFEQAERDLARPVVSAIAVGGAVPYIENTGGTPIPREYDGVAVNMSIPIFTGHLYSARQSEAHFQTLAQTERLRDLKQQVERDVRASWASAATAYQRIPVSEELVKQARLGFDLSQGRYNLGLASIVEVTQAQLNLTQAEIENVSAIYDYKNMYAALQYTIGALR